MGYVLHLVIIITLYASLAVSLQLLVGYAGLFSVAQAGTFGLGAYSAVVIGRVFHVPLLFEPFIGAAVGGSACFGASYLLTRLKREEFFLASLALQFALLAVFANMENLTGGALGLSGIAPYSGDPLVNKLIAMLFSIVTLVVTVYAVKRVSTAPIGRILRAARDDDLAAMSCGKDIAGARRAVFALVGVLAGAVGAIYAHYVTAIDPTSFSLGESILLVSIVVIGGAERIGSTLIAAGLLILLPEFLRYLPLPSSAGQEIRQVLLGMIFLITVRYRPEGLLSGALGRQMPPRTPAEVTTDG